MTYICHFSRTSKVTIPAYISFLHPLDLLHYMADNDRRNAHKRYKLCLMGDVDTCRYLVGNCRYL